MQRRGAEPEQPRPPPPLLYRSIARTFDKVGQNPWNDNLSEFERHLSELSEDSMYKVLMASQQAQELDPETAGRAREVSIQYSKLTVLYSTQYYYF